ncbi:hypothetical protein ABID56_001183 [Alkalibacillus flavidus]|uniref:Lipoprotein n=1 Tax=Alkalibacillus flavidus TaxID=546021 RepID=A0ABV2KU37_9BACI
MRQLYLYIVVFAILLLSGCSVTNLLEKSDTESQSPNIEEKSRDEEKVQGKSQQEEQIDTNSNTQTENVQDELGKTQAHILDCIDQFNQHINKVKLPSQKLRYRSSYNTRSTLAADNRFHLTLHMQVEMPQKPVEYKPFQLDVVPYAEEKYTHYESTFNREKVSYNDGTFDVLINYEEPELVFADNTYLYHMTSNTNRPEHEAVPMNVDELMNVVSNFSEDSVYKKFYTAGMEQFSIPNYIPNLDKDPITLQMVYTHDGLQVDNTKKEFHVQNETIHITQKQDELRQVEEVLKETEQHDLFKKFKVNQRSGYLLETGPNDFAAQTGEQNILISKPKVAQSESAKVRPKEIDNWNKIVKRTFESMFK